MALGDTSPRTEVGAPGQTRPERLQFTRSLVPLGERGAATWGPQEGGGGLEFEFEFDLLHYWRVIWKHKLLIVATVVVCLAVAAVLTFLATPIYTAQTTLQIDREDAKVVNMQDVQPGEREGDSEEFYLTQYGLLGSHALAERVVQRLGLAQSPYFLKVSGLAKSKPGSGATERQRRVFQDAVVKKVSKSLTVSPTPSSRLVTLGFDSPDPDIAAQIANSFADSFIQTNLERRFESSSYARDFLERQLALAKTKLDDSERETVAYAISQQIINLHDNQGGGAAGPNAAEPLVELNLAAMNAALSAASAARIEAQSKWTLAASTPGLGLPQVLQSPTIQQLSQEKSRLESEYQEQMRLFKPGYPAMQELKAQLDSVNARLQTEADTIKQSLYAAYGASLAQEQGLQKQVDALKASDLNLKGRSIRYDFLQRETDTNRTLYDGLLQRYKEIGVTGAIAPNNVAIVDRAQPPLRPSKPKPAINMAVALLVGLGLGVVGAFGVEALDLAIRTPGDVESKLRVPVLGAVPLLVKGVTPHEAMKDSRSTFWEAHYSIRTALQFSTTSGVPQSLVLLSARPGEGKSTTASALAHSLARLGAKTLLVDADLRKPSLHKLLGLQAAPGLSNYLTGVAPLDEILQPAIQQNLWVVTSGPLPPTPAELLADNRLRAFITEAEKRFDVVLIDGPPVMGFADALMIAAVAAGAVLVVESGKTARGQANSALRRLRMGHAKVLGAVLAKYDVRKAASYGYGYGYAYDAYEYGDNNKSKTKKVAHGA